VKQCRRCNQEAVDIIRESIVRRGPRSYLVCWYRCSACQDVSFGYRLFPESGEAGPSRELPDFDRESSTFEETPKSDTPLSV
jgi:hypothetical protein